jgi:hypothetical protein
MKVTNAAPFRTVLPLPAFVLHPLTAVVITVAHIYLAAGHLSSLFGGEVAWTHIWKGFGALGGAYVRGTGVARACPTRRLVHSRRHCMAEAKGNGWTVMKNDWKKIFTFEQ